MTMPNIFAEEFTTVDVAKLDENFNYLESSIATLVSIGIAQTWQDMTVARAIGTTYTNTTGKPIMVSVSVASVSASGGAMDFYIDGVIVASQGAVQNASIATKPNITIIVPAGSTYSIANVVSGLASIQLTRWFELR